MLVLRSLRCASIAPLLSVPGAAMFQFVTRLFRKQPAEVEQYHLPSDDPGLNPIVVEETEDIPMEEVVALNSRLLAPVNPLDPANMSARSRAVVEIKTGLNDLGDH